MKLKSRDEELKHVIRYKQNNTCRPMHYTPNLWIHVSRVTWLTEVACKQLGIDKELTQKIVRRAMFHDDSEIVVGDYVSPQKDGWSKEEKEAYQHACENATNTLVDNYASELGSDYGEILQEMESHQNEDSYDETSFIHALVEYTDKLDALMEIAHELHSGSSGFLNNLKEEFGIDKVCLKYVIDRVDKRRNKLSQFPNYKILSEGVFNIEQIHELDIHKIVENGSKHTPESVKKKSGIEIYDLWKELHFQNGTPEHIAYLYTEHVT